MRRSGWKPSSGWHLSPSGRQVPTAPTAPRPRALTAGLITLAIGAAWLALTVRLCVRRLHGTAHSVSHVAEMALTSILLPPLAVFWRLAGAVRFRVRFA